MIMAKLKDADIASRPKGIDQIPDEEIARHAARHGEVARANRSTSTPRATVRNWPPRKRPRSR